jgi:predicted chitinase
LQIHRVYFQDSGVKGSYSQVADFAFARRVATAYFKRYAPRAWAAGDVVTLARIHNGGPSGHRKQSTLAYARKVLAAMK